MNSSFCSRQPDRLLQLQSNSGSPRLLQHLPEIRQMLEHEPEDRFSYLNANDPSDPDARALSRAIADREGVSPDALVIWAKGYRAILNLPHALKAHTIVTFRGDFAAYARAASLAGARHVEVEQPTVDSFLAAVPHGDGVLVIWTDHALNPSLVEVPTLVMIEVARRHRPEAVLIVDDAYGRYATSDGRAAVLAATSSQLVFLRPASKDLLVSGLGVAHTIARPASPVALALAAAQPPFCVLRVDAQAAARLYARPDLVAAAAALQSRARVALCAALAERKLTYRAGIASWVLLQPPTDASDLGRRLAREHGILVQDQKAVQPHLSGMLRISTTLEEEMEAFVAALDELGEEGAC